MCVRNILPATINAHAPYTLIQYLSKLEEDETEAAEPRHVLDRRRKWAVKIFSEERDVPKEYILVIEGSVPPIVVHRKHFPPPLSLPALSAVIQTDR